LTATCYRPWSKDLECVPIILCTKQSAAKARELEIPLMPSTLRGEDDSHRQGDEQPGPTENVMSTRI
jgi:hypothetical protein